MEVAGVLQDAVMMMVVMTKTWVLALLLLPR